MGRRIRVVAASTCLALLAAGCSRAAASHDDDPVIGPASGSTSTTTSTTSTTTTLPPTTTTTLAPPPTAPPTTTAPSPRAIDRLGLPFALVGAVTLGYPSRAVARVGFHQSASSAAQELTPDPTVIEPHDMGTRDRGTGERTAADVVVQPGTTVYAPVSGTVLQAGHYQLYCSYDDETVVVAPDGQPSWHVTILHLQGVLVTQGQHLIAGQTPIATQAHKLPFRSQVDKYSRVRPAWPHVHTEVDDPAIPDQPSKGDSCGLL
jgi:biotin carboxyl carrier protein